LGANVDFWADLHKNNDIHAGFRYDDTGFVSHHDAEQALEAARDYLAVVRADINARKP